jgi:hypothetical protein
MARHGYVRLQVQYSCTETWSMARTDRSPRDSRCDVSMGGGDGETPALDRVSRVHRRRTVARSTDRTMVRCMEREGPEHTVLFLDESTVRMDRYGR